MDWWNSLGDGLSLEQVSHYDKSSSPIGEDDSFLQLKRILYAGDFSLEGLVDLQTLLYNIARVDDGRVIAITNELSDTTCRHARILRCKIHRHLAHLNVITLAALTEHVLLADAVVMANLLENIVDRKRMIINLHGTLDDALGQLHIDIRVIDNRISHQGVDHTLKIAHTAVSSVSNKLDDICRYLQTVATAFGIEDIDAQLSIGLLKLSNQST